MIALKPWWDLERPEVLPRSNDHRSSTEHETLFAVVCCCHEDNDPRVLSDQNDLCWYTWFRYRIDESV
jgi:hypothetical protein